MAGDTRLFQEALKRGSDHAWNGRWERALEEYRVALEQFPEDISARTYMAMAAFRAGQLSTALELYQGLWKSQPSNLAMLQRMAELQEATGDRGSAAASFRVLAEIYGRRRSFKDAFKAWQKVVELKPEDPFLWGSLMDVAAQMGALAEVMPGYLKLARNLALQGRFQEAIQVAERASALDPKNLSVMGLLSAIRRALEYSWRATSQGDEIPLDLLPDLIPPVDGAQPLPNEAEALPSEAAVQRTEPPGTVPDSVPQPEQSLPESPSEDVRTKSLPVLEPTPAASSVAGGPPGPVAPAAATREGPAAQDAPGAELPASSPVPEVATFERPGEGSPPEEGECRPAELLLAKEDAGRAGAASEMSADEGEAPAAVEEERPEAEELEEVAVETGQLEKTIAEPGEGESVVAGAGRPEEAASAPSEEMEAADLLDVQEEETPIREDLILQAQEARTSGRLIEAVAMYQEAIAAGAATAELLAELAETYQQMGQGEEAAAAYGQALELDPRLPSALLGMGRHRLAAGQWEAAEEMLSEALEVSAEAGEADGEILELLLEALKERAASGNWGQVVARLAWLRAGFLPTRLAPAAADSLLSSCVDLLGQCAGEHLEEVASLPAEDRGQVVLALRSAEDRLRRGELRSAADEMYRMLGAGGDFLPAHSLLGRVLVAQGRVTEAKERAQRLLELYDLRGAPWQALEVLWWVAAHGVGDGEARAHLVQMLREQNRSSEAEMVELGWRELAPGGAAAGLPAGPPAAAPDPSGGQTPPSPQESWTLAATAILDAGPPRLETGVGPAVPDVMVPKGPPPAQQVDAAKEVSEPDTEEVPEAKAEEVPASEVEEVPAAGLPPQGELLAATGDVVESPEPIAGPRLLPDLLEIAEDQEHGEPSPRDAVLKLAEASFAAGDRAGAMTLLHSALEAGWMDGATRSAFVRILEVLRAGPGAVSDG